MIQAEVVESAQYEGRRWCLGDDSDLDSPGDQGPDLVWFEMVRVCEDDGLVQILLRTSHPPEVVELVFDTDLDETTGCDGIDVVHVVLHSASTQRVRTPTCDPADWVSQGGHLARTRNSREGPYLEVWVWGDDARESIWYPAVGNLDGTGYDTSWQRYYSASHWIDCERNASDYPEAEDGYWLIGIDGSVHSFGSAPELGHACLSGLGARQIADFELATYGELCDPRYGWIALRRDGSIHVADKTVMVAERPWKLGATEAVSLLVAPQADCNVPAMTVVYDNGATSVIEHGYQVAPQHGDLSGTSLNWPVIDSIATADQDGYWMVAGDGGVFSFGRAPFLGSMGHVALNAPVVGIAADPDASGYWLVASDGGIFAFDAPFRGSAPAVLPAGAELNRPIVGMIPYGNGYLMFASDGGVFNFSDRGFAGSLGDNPPMAPIVGAVAIPDNAG